MARVESRTVISTPQKLETIPPTAEGVTGRLGHWISPRDLDAKVQELFPGCMQGRLIFVGIHESCIYQRKCSKLNK